MKGMLTVLFLTLSSSDLTDTPVIGGPCQGCEFVFVGMPLKPVTHSTIAPETEKGEKLNLTGTIVNEDGKSAEGIIVYAYQTNDEGIYPEGETWHGQLRGWAITNQNGEYSFRTVRPKAYPNRDTPQHIHLHVIEPNKGTYYIDDVTFDDDPLLSQEYREKANCRGGCGLSTPEKDTDGEWKVSRLIVLGKNIPNY